MIQCNSKTLFIGNFHDKKRIIDIIKVDSEHCIYFTNNVFEYEEILKNCYNGILSYSIPDTLDDIARIIIVTSSFDGKYTILKRIVDSLNFLSVNGKIYILTSKKTGYSFVRKLLKYLNYSFSESIKDDGTRMVFFVKTDSRKFDLKNIGYAFGIETDLVFDETIFGINFRFQSEQTLFSKSRADQGSLFLLETIYKNSKISPQDIVLDYGCGYGILGIVLARVFCPNSVDFIDINAAACEKTSNNIKLNNLTCHSSVFMRSNLRELRNKYSVIVSHFPLHVPHEKKISMLSECHDALLPDGRLICVIPSTYDFSKIALKIFKHYQVVADSVASGYYVFQAY